MSIVQMQRHIFEIMAPVLERAVDSAVDDVKDRIRADSPEASGATKRSIDHFRPGRFTVTVYATTPQAKIQDKGTSPYTIVPKRKKALFWEGALHPVGKVNHPGVRKHVGWWSDAPWQAWWADALKANMP